ncbi:thioredoxin 1 [Pelomyxa schiedti]|nr:thioredoxin 1 [Pelomyxa schiedti]
MLSAASSSVVQQQCLLASPLHTTIGCRRTAPCSVGQDNAARGRVALYHSSPTALPRRFGTRDLDLWPTEALVVGCLPPVHVPRPQSRGAHLHTQPQAQAPETKVDPMSGPQNLKECVGEAQFKELVMDNMENPVVVDFYEVWCGPCRKMGLHIEQLANENPSVSFVKVQLKLNKELTKKYQLSSIPTLFFISRGQIVAKMIGADMNELQTQFQILLQHHQGA